MASFRHAGSPGQLRQPPVVSLRADSGFTSLVVLGPSEAGPEVVRGEGRRRGLGRAQRPPLLLGRSLSCGTGTRKDGLAGLSCAAGCIRWKDGSAACCGRACCAPRERPPSSTPMCCGSSIRRGHSQWTFVHRGGWNQLTTWPSGTSVA